WIASPWNSNLLMDEALTLTGLPRGLPAAALGLILLIAVAVMLRRDRAAVTMHFVGSTLILVFVYLKYSGGMRHHGHLFILLVACLWIARRGVRPAQASPWLVALLACHVVAGAYFVVDDLRRPFSFSKELTDYVRTLPRSTPVV